MCASALGWQVVAADMRCHPGLQAYGRGSLEWREVDITSRDQIEDVVAWVNPDTVVNLAALADIDCAEQEHDLAWRINVEGARMVAESCAERGIRHIFFSSDAVFDGRAGPYKEDDPHAPLNYYGRTKSEAEIAVLAAQPAAALLRISLVLGFPVTSGNSYLAGLAAKLNLGAEITSPQDEIRTPVDVHTLCDSVLELAKIPYAGVLHVGCTESIDRYSLAVHLARRMGYDARKIHPEGEYPDSPNRAPRHKRGILNVSRARDVLKTPMLNLDETIQRAISG